MAPKAQTATSSSNHKTMEGDALLVDNYCESRVSSSRANSYGVVSPKVPKKRKKFPCETSIPCSGAAVGLRTPSQDDNREDIAMFRNRESSRILQCRRLPSSSTAHTNRELLEGSPEDAISHWGLQRSAHPVTYQGSDSLSPNKKAISFKRMKKPSKDYTFAQCPEKVVRSLHHGSTSWNKDSQDAHLSGPIYNPSASTNVAAAMALASLMSTNGGSGNVLSSAVGREEVEYNTIDQDCRDSVNPSSSDELSSPCSDYDEEYNMKKPSSKVVFSISPTSTSVSNTTALSVVSSGKNVQCYDDTWKIRFNDLVAYKRQYGDCLVPKKSNSHPQLGIWVMNQRGKKIQLFFFYIFLFLSLFCFLSNHHV